MNSVVIYNASCEVIQSPFCIVAFLFVMFLITLPEKKGSSLDLSIRAAFYSVLPYIAKGIALLVMSKLYYIEEGAMDLYILRIFTFFLIGICTFSLVSILAEVSEKLPSYKTADPAPVVARAAFLAACFTLFLWVAKTLVIVVP